MVNIKQNTISSNGSGWEAKHNNEQSMHPHLQSHLSYQHMGMNYATFMSEQVFTMKLIK